MYQSIYVDSMIDQRRTAGLDRELERRRIAIERGTMRPTRLGLFTRLGAAFAPRRSRTQVGHTPIRQTQAAQREVRHA